MRDNRSNSSRATRSQSGYPRGPAQPGPTKRTPQQGGSVREYSHSSGTAQAAHAKAPFKSTAGKSGAVPVIGIGSVLLIAVVAVVVIIGMVKNADKNKYYSENITPGITINGADVSGKDAETLKSELNRQYQTVIDDISVKITHEDESWVLTGQDLGATHNVDEVIDSAALLARTGSIEQRRADAKAIKEAGRAFTIDLKLDQDLLKGKLEEIASRVSTAGQDASVVFNPALVDFEIPKDIEDLDPPQSLIDSMFHINPETSGQTMDVEMMTQRINEDLADDYRAEVEMIVTGFVPQLTEAKLRTSFHLLSAYRTKLSSTSTDDRVHNIELALSGFNGLILYPGQELSFNDTTGARSESNGYRLAPTIGGDKSLVDDFGGGVCQASTTLYNAALMSGCEVLERHHHSIPSSYAIKGFDAMVNYPSSDLKFKSASELPLYIKAYVKRPYVYVMVFGAPLTDGTTIERVSEIVLEGPTPEVEIRIDEEGEYIAEVQYQDDEPYVAINSHPELRVKAILVYKDSNSNEISRKELYEDHFKEIQGVAYVGKEIKPTSTPKPQASPTPEPAS